MHLVVGMVKNCVANVQPKGRQVSIALLNKSGWHEVCVVLVGEVVMEHCC